MTLLFQYDAHFVMCCKLHVNHSLFLLALVSLFSHHAPFLAIITSRRFKAFTRFYIVEKNNLEYRSKQVETGSIISPMDFLNTLVVLLVLIEIVANGEIPKSLIVRRCSERKKLKRDFAQTRQ